MKLRITKIVPHVIFYGLGHLIFVEIQTDAGITGVGEASLDSKTEAVLGALHDLEDYLVGADPTRIEHHWQRMFRQSWFRGGVVIGTAIAGLEQALWDILGKVLGVSVCDLLGGPVHDRVRLYVNGPVGQTPEEVADSAARLVSDGWSAMKFCPLPVVSAVAGSEEIRHTRRIFDAVRRAVGPDVLLAIDCLGRLTPASALQIEQALREYHLFFIEEPLPPGNVPALARVSSRMQIPVATGERLYGRWDFREVLERRAVQIIQPDLCHCGGLWEGKKIAAMAEAQGISFAPHCPYSLIQLMVNLQVNFTCSNFLIQEYFIKGHLPLVRELFANGLNISRGGWVDRPQGAGLGFELNWDAVRFYGSQPYKRTMVGTPHLWHQDGSAADW